MFYFLQFCPTVFEYKDLMYCIYLLQVNVPQNTIYFISFIYQLCFYPVTSKSHLPTWLGLLALTDPPTLCSD